MTDNIQKTDTERSGNAEFHDTPCSAELLQDWIEARTERAKAREQREHNMFYGPIGIEEAVLMNKEDIQMLLWFLDKSLKKIAELEKRLNS